LSHLVATQQTDWALRLAVALYRYWDHREYLSEGRAWFEAVLDLAGAERRKAGRARALNYAAALAERVLCADRPRISVTRTSKLREDAKD